MPGKLLLVNACVRRERSRTLRLARALIKRYPDYTVDEMVLEDMHLQPLDSDFLDRRDALIEKGGFDDPIFSVAHRYSPEGMPIGMCRAKVLYYVTTRGGPIPDEGDLGYAVYRALCGIYGIKECRIVSVSGLDLITNDPGSRMEDALRSIEGMEVI